MCIAGSTVYTIGYSGFSDTAMFVDYLKEHDIRLLIDVRSSPYSTHYYQYDKPVLSETLKKADIQYRNYQNEFGARQENREYYQNGRLDFVTFTKNSPMFASGRDKVAAAIRLGYTPVLMCAEKEPSKCHRAIMISRALSDEGYSIRHLMPDGSEKTQHDIEDDLLQCYFKDRNQLSMFDEYRSEIELIPQAYAKRNDEIGYRGDNQEV